MQRNNIFMKEALNLARKADGRTSPNPMVGAVVVKNGRVLGRGYHRKAGGPHAEITALKEAKKKAAGSDLYVNLEPCDHFGKTPPCTDAIISSGVKNVIVGMRDPNPLNNGRGIRRLKKHGVKVTENILKKESEELNRAFIKFVTTGIPYVSVKVAQSLDGKISAGSGDSRWISNEKSRRYVHILRNRVDAVLVGINTALKDDPELTSRLTGRVKKQPKKIVVDSQLRISLRSKILKDPHSVIIATTRKASPSKKNRLKKIGVDIITTNTAGARVDLKNLMHSLARRGITHVLVEGGGEIVSSFLRKDLVDEIFFFVAPKIIGGRDALTSVEGRGVKFANQAMRLQDVSVGRFGADILIHAKPLNRKKTGRKCSPV